MPGERTYRLLLEYDGTRFAGWQRQDPPNHARTVQEEVERALASVTQTHPAVIGAGRTDAGVHARGQVASVRLPATWEPAELARALGARLPHDVVCRDARLAADAFHARYDGRARRYSYTISRRPRAIGRFYAWHVGWALPIDRLQAPADAIMGEHDFTSFSKAHGAAHHHRCAVRISRWIEAGDDLTYTIVADRFVYSMVRALVGAMVNVGRGKIRAEEFSEILAACDRARNRNPLAPPHGLCLEEVEYESA